MLDIRNRCVQPARDFVQSLLTSAFPHQLSGPRHVGLEEEFPVVNIRGEIVDISPLFTTLIEDGLMPKFDEVTGTLIGVKNGLLEIGQDVGIGTLEIAFPHTASLFEHMDERKRILSMVDSRLARHGMHRLIDYATQPLTAPTRDLWSHKGRGYFFRDFFVPEVHVQTLSAASQAHFDVARDEVLPVLELLLSVSPIFIALNANSPVWNGQLDPAGMLAARQAYWYGFTANNGYWNNVFCGPRAMYASDVRLQHAPSSYEELSSFLSVATFIVRVHEGKIHTPDMPFETWFAGVDLDSQTQRDSYLNHEGTVWWDARPRVAYGTIEFRPVCQNRHGVSSHALVLGLIENLDASIKFVRESMTFQAWRTLQHRTLKDGLRVEGVLDLASSLIQLGEEGLRRRGFGEENLLEPLKRRVRDGQSPGHVKRDIFCAQGINTLIEHLLNP